MHRNATLGWVEGWRAALIVAAVCLLPAVVSARANIIAYPTVTWNLDNVVFADGGTASGYVVVAYNGDEKYVDDWNISVAGITDPSDNTAVGPFTYDPYNSTFTLTGDPLFDVLQSDPSELQWNVDLLPITGGVEDITSGFFQWSDPYTTLIVSGSMDSTPEPPAWTLAGAGALLLAGLAWRQRRDFSYLQP